ncbi:hypothetical protein MG293_012037 [Ovis ammon polii]|uniref:Uncharacterized protein n=1 Tax=Ovis ammon polii TaxID=230172 RepID=A0AAD4U625_OVIAM|nr:hypothetical protein MG293_012037 [Ovis ammon polii]
MNKSKVCGCEPFGGRITCGHTKNCKKGTASLPLKNHGCPQQARTGRSQKPMDSEAVASHLGIVPRILQERHGDTCPAIKSTLSAAASQTLSFLICEIRVIPEKSTSPTLSGGIGTQKHRLLVPDGLTALEPRASRVQSPVVGTGDKACDLRYQIASPVEVKRKRSVPHL